MKYRQYPEVTSLNNDDVTLFSVYNGGDTYTGQVPWSVFLTSTATGLNLSTYATKVYADAAAAGALSDANDYTDTEVAGATIAANSYADGVAATALSDANDYTDTAIGALGDVLTTKPSFKALKSATQTLTIGVNTKITFVTESWDTGNYYDTTNSRWTPPAGKINIFARVQQLNGGLNAPSVFTGIYKNGSYLTGSGSNAYNFTGAAGDNTAEPSISDIANGTDYYEVYATAYGIGNQDIGAPASVFWGEFSTDN